MKNIKQLVTIAAIGLSAMSLSGCVAGALVPVVLNLAAEGATVAYTDKTITENLKDAINEQKKANAAAEGGTEIASLSVAPVPPRKPTPPRMKSQVPSAPLVVTAQPMAILISEN